MGVLTRLFAVRARHDADFQQDVVTSPKRAGAAMLEPSRDTEVAAEAAAQIAAGRYAESLKQIDRALALAPDAPELFWSRASTLFAWGRLREARAFFLRAETAGVRNGQIYLHLGWSSLLTGNAFDAELWMRKAVAAGPDSWMPHFGLAAVLRAQKRGSDAVAEYERAVELQPDCFDCLNQFAVCQLDRGELVAAEGLARHAIAVDNERSMPWANLGIALARQNRFDVAREPFERAMALEKRKGEEADCFVNYATYLRDIGRTGEAIELYEQNLSHRPNAFACGDYAMTLLTAGRLAEGWRHYEFRWFTDPLLSTRPAFPVPTWSGQDLRGKTIMLRAEQGAGDFVQFIRYAPDVRALGGTVLLQVRDGLEALAAGCTGIDRVLERDKAIPGFDYWTHLLSLPRIFGTDLSSIPARIPYLRADPLRVERWGDRLRADGALKVGLSWAGSPTHVRDRHRSMSLRTLAPVMEVAGARFYSLQKGAAAMEMHGVVPETDLVNLGAELGDFADTVAVISQLDLVLCVDTSVAHIAGALGKPVWVMLPQPADFRWLEKREDSPWYPTMRLFRQRRFGHWSEVVERVKAALQEWLSDAKAQATGDYSARPSPQLRTTVPALDDPSRRGHRFGFSAVTEARVGIVQFLPDDGPMGESVGWYGEFLQPQVDLLTRLLKPGATVLEAYAGIGLHALAIARAIGAEGHLMLYESRPVPRRILQQNLAANRVTNVTLMRRQLGSSKRAPEDAGTPSVTNSAPSSAGTVVTETLDELRLEQLAWLKIDEGGPAIEILEGAEETIWRLRPLLFIAALDDSMLRGLAGRVRRFGYRCWRMETALFNPDNFNRRDADIFSGRTALALLAIPEEIEVDVTLDGCREIL